MNFTCSLAWIYLKSDATINITAMVWHCNVMLYCLQSSSWSSCGITTRHVNVVVVVGGGVDGDNELHVLGLGRGNAMLNHPYPQGNYATQNSSSMCHLMPQRHLPEWREEDEQAFVHCGSSGLNHAITWANGVCHRAFQSVICHFIVTSCKCRNDNGSGIVLSRLLFGFQMPRCTNARSSSSLYSDKCRCVIKWHSMPLLSWMVLFPCVHLWLFHGSALVIRSMNLQLDLKYMACVGLNGKKIKDLSHIWKKMLCIFFFFFRKWTKRSELILFSVILVVWFVRI